MIREIVLYQDSCLETHCDPGAFRYVRHPLYLTSILFYLCLTVTTASLLALVLFAGIAVFYSYIADYEEGVLLAKYGEEYSEYRERTGKWLPCIGPGRYRKRRSEKDDPG